jgi:hypothetical protein
LAIQEGRLAKFGVKIPAEAEYPSLCPFTMEQLLDEEFMGIEDSTEAPNP